MELTVHILLELPVDVFQLCSALMESATAMHVCGRMIGYQYSAPTAFDTSIVSIDSTYVDGVSLTHGPPGARQHIWTFAAGWGEHNTRNYGCPCSNLSHPLARVSSFVRNDFFWIWGATGKQLGLSMC